MDIKPAPKLSLRTVGPGVVLIAMGLGSGEFVLWPYLVAQFGFGVLWGALVGITFQYFVSNESGRYTLLSGNSVFNGFARLWRYFPHWFLISTFLSFAWPGIIGTGGQLLGHLLNIPDSRWLTATMLLAIGLVLTFGGKVYTNLKRLQIVFICISVPLLVILSLLVIDGNTVVEVGKGLVGIGQDYFLFPSGILIGTFLGAIAYAGAGGNLVFSHSFYIQDEGWGAAQGKDTQITLSKRAAVVEHTMITVDPENKAAIKSWLRFAAREQFFTFWGIGLFTIVLLTLLAYALAHPFAGSEGISFIFDQADTLATRFAPIWGSAFVALGVFFLFSTQLGVFEATSRIMTENLVIALGAGKKYSLGRIYFAFVWAQVLFAIVITLLNISAPLQILFVNTFFSAVSMLVGSIAVLWLSVSNLLPKDLKPSLLRLLMLALSILFFGIFVAVTVVDLFD